MGSSIPGQSRRAAQKQIPQTAALWAQMYPEPHSSGPNVTTGNTVYFLSFILVSLSDKLLGFSGTFRSNSYWSRIDPKMTDLVNPFPASFSPLVCLLEVTISCFPLVRLIIWLLFTYLYEIKLEGDFWVGLVLIFGFVIFCGRLCYNPQQPSAIKCQR